MCGHFLLLYMLILFFCVDTSVVLLDKDIDVLGLMIQHGIIESLCEIFCTCTAGDTLVWRLWLCVIYFSLFLVLSDNEYTSGMSDCGACKYPSTWHIYMFWIIRNAFASNDYGFSFLVLFFPCTHKIEWKFRCQSARSDCIEKMDWRRRMYSSNSGRKWTAR